MIVAVGKRTDMASILTYSTKMRTVSMLAKGVFPMNHNIIPMQCHRTFMAIYNDLHFDIDEQLIGTSIGVSHMYALQYHIPKYSKTRTKLFMLEINQILIRNKQNLFFFLFNPSISNGFFNPINKLCDTCSNEWRLFFHVRNDSDLNEYGLCDCVSYQSN